MIKSVLIAGRCTDRVDFDVADRAAKPQSHEAALINADLWVGADHDRVAAVA